MQQLKIAHDPNEKARLSRRVKALLDDAEKLKHRSKWTSAPLAGPAQASAAPQQGGVEPTSSKSSSRVLKEPFSSRISTKAEQILLLKASFLNNFKFPPWSEPPDPSEFELREGEEAFTYVSLLGVPLTFPTDFQRTQVTRRTCRFLSSKKMSLTRGNDLETLCLHRDGALRALTAYSQQ